MKSATSNAEKDEKKMTINMKKSGNNYNKKKWP